MRRGHLVGATRMIFYRRGDSRFRLGISLLASLLGASMAISGLEIILYQQTVSVWRAIGACALCVLIFRSRGNIAALLRPSP
ncbi:phage holin family protein [Pseudomonas knackmussii]|uniref:phage holin family protein n=1 Tax=Pseudomonas knackmussii TaxID=65741 RepID=UPI0005BA139B|nr:phage holin family protein [Pseudomonas knackmussii]